MAGLFLLYQHPATSKVALVSKWMHLTVSVPTSLYRAINSSAAAPLIAWMYTSVRLTTPLNYLPVDAMHNVDITGLHACSPSGQDLPFYIMSASSPT